MAEVFQKLRSNGAQDVFLCFTIENPDKHGPEDEAIVVSRVALFEVDDRRARRFYEAIRRAFRKIFLKE